jgi:hypothetical protein
MSSIGLFSARDMIAFHLLVYAFCDTTPLTVLTWFGVKQVVQWFVERGCKDMELCLALTAAASSSRVEVAAFLLSHVPHHVLQTLSAEILKVFLVSKDIPASVP